MPMFALKRKKWQNGTTKKKNGWRCCQVMLAPGKRLSCTRYSLLRKKEFGTFEFPEEKYSEKGEKNTKPWVTCGDVMSDLDTITEEEKLQRPGSKDYELLLQVPPGDNYLYFTEKRGYPDPIFKWKSRYWTFLLKLTPKRPSWTIQASFSNNQGPFHWRNRFLRIEEIKRIQTIDDNYIITGDFKNQWRQIGNAVPSTLAFEFAKQIKKYL